MLEELPEMKLHFPLHHMSHTEDQMSVKSQVIIKSNDCIHCHHPQTIMHIVQTC